MITKRVISSKRLESEGVVIDALRLCTVGMYFLLMVMVPMMLVDQAKAEHPKSDADFALLPPYCQARMRETSDADRWKQALGPEFIHIHHYCNGLHTMNLLPLFKDDPKRLRYEMQYALNQFDYILERARKDFVLLPEVHLKRGQALIQLDQKAAAAQEYLKAMQIKPDYIRPYAEMSDLYLSMGNKDEARKILEEGLKHSPKSSLLRRRLRKIE